MKKILGGTALFMAVMLGMAYAQVPGFFSTIIASVSVTSPHFIGNADTATALAASPSQCSGSTPLATGIAASGNANCTGVSVIQNQTNPSRAFTTIYQNTTGKVMFVTVSTTTGAGPAAGTSSALSDSSPTPTQQVAQESCIAVSAGAVSGSMTFIVLPGNYYEVTTTGTQFQAAWSEWF